MRIALISPKSSFLGRNVEFKKFLDQSPEMEFYRQYWAGLGSGLLILGALTPKDAAVELIDENIELIDFNKSYDLVAITAMTQQATRAYQIAKEFREKNVTVVMGGIHATVLPDEATSHADSVVIGEAEGVWQKLLQDFQNGSLQRRYAAQRQIDLKESPLPRYELLEGKPYNIVWVQATRGCPHDCSFCCASRIYGSRYRHKSIDQVIQEIQEIRKVKKNALIGFADDNLFCDKHYSRELLEKVDDLNIRWIAQSDISIAHNNDMLKLIKKSGCVVLLIGFESIDENNLRGLDPTDWKRKRLNKYVDSIDTIQKSGIGIIGTFIVGFDNDDRSTFGKLAAFIIDNHLAGAQIAALTPFPRTGVGESLRRENRVLDTPWENYTLYDVNIMPKKMSPQELEEGLLDTFKRVYSPTVAAEKNRYFKNIYFHMRRRSE